jgi:galactose-1-phosphate uridylyltransferase
MSDRWAIVENDLIVNVIVADKDFIAANYPDAILCNENVGVGDGFDGENFYSNSIVVTIDESETL